MPRLQIRTDGHSLVPREADAITFDREVRARFGIKDPFVVVIETRVGHTADSTREASDEQTAPSAGTGVFNASTLALIRELTERLQSFPEIDDGDVMSLATERGDRVYPGTLDFRPFLDPLPRTPLEVQRVRADLDVVDLYRGTLVSRDGRAAGIFVGVPDAVNRTALHQRMHSLLAEYETRPERLHLVGGPVAETLLGTHLLDDLGVPDWITGTTVARGRPVDASGGGIGYRVRLSVARTIGLLPIALLLMALVFFACFRRVVASLLPLVEVGACLVFVLGLMGWCDVPVTLTIAVMPVILTAVGIADEIHVFMRFRQHAREAPDVPARSLVQRTMNEMTRPIFKTSVTTAIGFGSFALSPIGAVQSFGVFTAIGVIFCMLWSLTVVPVCLERLPRRWLVDSRRAGGAHAIDGWSALATFVLRRRVWIIGAALLVMLGAGVGLRRVVVQDSWIDGFARDSAFYQATTRFNEQFLGAHVLLVTVDAPSRAFLESLPLIDAMCAFESFIADRTSDRVGGVLGPCRYVTTSNFLLGGRQESYARPPKTPTRLERVWREFERVRGTSRLRQLVDPEYGRAIVTVFLGHANFRDTQRLMERIRHYEAEHLTPMGVTIGFAGDVAVSQTLIDAIVSTQVRSLLASLIGIIAVTTLLGRSVAWGLLCVLPCALAVMANFTAMGFAGVPLGVATSMFAGMTIGIGVDFAVHLLERYRHAIDVGHDHARAIADSLRVTGPAILVDGAAVALGFSVLLLSQVPANTRLGGLLAASVAACVFATLFILPALLSVRPLISTDGGP